MQGKSLALCSYTGSSSYTSSSSFWHMHQKTYLESTQIYGAPKRSKFSTSFMCAQLHLCLLSFIYACSTSFMRAQLHLCVLNFIYACSTSFMLAKLHLCVLNFIYAYSTSFMHPQLFSPCSTSFTMLNFFTSFTHVFTIIIALCVTA